MGEKRLQSIMQCFAEEDLGNKLARDLGVGPVMGSMMSVTRLTRRQEAAAARLQSLGSAHLRS